MPTTCDNIPLAPAPRWPRGVAFDGSGIWVATSTEITRLRAVDGRRTGAFKPVNDPYGIVFDDGNDVRRLY